jgi:hypothetical protein
MTDEGSPTIADADVRSLAAKLMGLHALLTPPEQVLLRTVLRRAAEREGMGVADAAGFVWAVSFNPLIYLDAIRSAGAAEKDGQDG